MYTGLLLFTLQRPRHCVAEKLCHVCGVELLVPVGPFLPNAYPRCRSTGGSTGESLRWFLTSLKLLSEGLIRRGELAKTVLSTQPLVASCLSLMFECKDLFRFLPQVLLNTVMTTKLTSTAKLYLCRAEILLCLCQFCLELGDRLIVQVPLLLRLRTLQLS